jgi:putative endonuclease
MTNRSRTLYTGVSNNLARRVWEHKNHLIPGFTSNYRIDRLVYYESTPSIQAAIRREKEIKGWSRPRKIALVTADNPWWDDLAEDWYD